MGKKGFFATLFVILILVFFLFPSSSATEYFLVPQKIVDLDKGKISDGTGGKREYSFLLGDYFGYFTGDLDLTYCGNRDYRVTVSDTSFINYPKIPKILDVQKPDGEGRSIIEEAGYPVIFGDRIIVLTDSSISLYDLNGNLFWKKEILSLITSLSASDGHVFLGYLDGSCELISDTGNDEFIYRPGGSRIESVYSVALSSDSQYLAVISGLDPQRFILLQKRKDGYKPVHHFELDHQYRRTVKMFFSNDNRKIFFEDPKGVDVFDISAKSLSLIKCEGSLVNIDIDRDSGFYSLLMKGDGEARIQILSDSTHILTDRVFPGEIFFFRKEGDRYYIGDDSKIMYLRMVEG